MVKNLWVVCSNRSEYGLIRPLLVKIAESEEFSLALKITLVFYSDALNSCIIDASRDFDDALINVVHWADTEIKKEESISEHLGRLTYKFSRNHFFKCDFLIIVGDRYETFSVAQAAFFQRIPIAHLFGGDISNGGHFDDHIRHAISQLASVHFPVNQTAYNNLIAMQQEVSRVFLIGSPVVDEIALLNETSEVESICDVLISFNPMTLQTSNVVEHSLRLTLEALELIQSQMHLRCLATYPNHEPGAQELIDIYNEFSDKEWFKIVGSLGSPKYLYAIKNSKIVIGNSSSQVLEVPLLGQRCLLIGDRQKGRHKPQSVVHVPLVSDVYAIKEIILNMLESAAPLPCTDFGVVGVSRNMIKLIIELIKLPKSFLVQKNKPLPNLAEAYLQ